MDGRRTWGSRRGGRSRRPIASSAISSARLKSRAVCRVSCSCANDDPHGVSTDEPPDPHVQEVDVNWPPEKIREFCEGERNDWWGLRLDPAMTPADRAPAVAAR